MFSLYILVAFELWTISDGIAFDNVLITSDPSVAHSITQNTYQVKKEISDNETDNWFVKMIKYTNKNPWMWAVYFIATAIPVVLFIAFCCVKPIKGSSSDQSSSQQQESIRKKTDEPTPDVIGGHSILHEEEEVEEEINENYDENIEDERENEEVEEEPEPEPEPEPDEEEEVEEEEEPEEIPQPKQSPRHRRSRPRKESN